jgi:hypothetical protein
VLVLSALGTILPQKRSPFARRQFGADVIIFDDRDNSTYPLVAQARGDKLFKFLGSPALSTVKQCSILSVRV